MNPIIVLVDDGEASNKEVNNMCDLVGMIVFYDGLFASEFEAFKFENNKENFSYEVMICRAECASLINPTTNDEFGEVEIVNEHMHAQIYNHKVDENYVDEICGLFFEIRTVITNHFPSNHF